METTDNVRERLLSRLPQTDELAAYRQEVATLLAKHERALYWDSFAASKVAGFAALAIFLLAGFVKAREPHIPLWNVNYLYFCAGGAFLAAMIHGVRYTSSRGQLMLLKEIKQLQLQVLELQSAIEKKDSA